MSLNAASAREMGRECDGLSPAESAEDAEEGAVLYVLYECNKIISNHLIILTKQGGK